MKRFSIATLGCKVNQYEAQALRERLVALGWRPARKGEQADLCVINTCTVTREADEKCRKLARRAARKNPRATILITGCAAVTAPEKYRAMPGVSAVLTRMQVMGIGEWLERDEIPAERDVFEMEIGSFAGHTRAFMKIQDGCDAFCAYCIVPHARGHVRSRPLAAIRAEAERLARAGHPEVVLTGIHLGFYGRHLLHREGREEREEQRTPDRNGVCDHERHEEHEERITQGNGFCNHEAHEGHEEQRIIRENENTAGASLVGAVREVLAVPSVERVRLSSLEALELSDELLALAAEDSRFCPHFHLPLQSGDDGILRAMRRRYTGREFLGVLDRARRKLDRASFTTDVMVGFPGETEEAFENTLRVCREAAFSRIHIFPFSPRPGTPAAELPERIAPQVIHEREARLKALADELALEYKRQFIGQVVHPLIERRRDRATGLLTGWCERYMKVLLAGSEELMGRIVPARVTAVSAESVTAVAAST